jgi:hypothetical protein
MLLTRTTEPGQIVSGREQEQGTAAPGSASSPISGARRRSSRAAISTGWRARSPVWRSGQWFCQWSRARPHPIAVCRRIGPALLFERLWQEIGCRAVLDELTAQRSADSPGPRPSVQQ